MVLANGGTRQDGASRLSFCINSRYTHTGTRFGTIPRKRKKIPPLIGLEIKMVTIWSDTSRQKKSNSIVWGLSGPDETRSLACRFILEEERTRDGDRHRQTDRHRHWQRRSMTSGAQKGALAIFRACQSPLHVFTQSHTIPTLGLASGQCHCPSTEGPVRP